MDTPFDYIRLHDAGEADPKLFGERGARLARLAAIGLPVPRGLLLPQPTVRRIAQEGAKSILADEIARRFGMLDKDVLLSLRASPERTEWGGPQALLNIGITDERLPMLAARTGMRGALELYFRLLQGFGTLVRGMDPEEFENLLYDHVKYAGAPTEADLPEAALRGLVAEAKALIAEDTDEPFPQDPVEQLCAAMDAAVRGWTATSARILRQARGAPEDAGLALIVQRMALGLGEGVCGAGIAHLVDDRSGVPGLTGRFLPQAQGQDALMGMRTPHLLTEAERERAGQSAASLEALMPGAPEALRDAWDRAAHGLGESYSFEFTVERGELSILDAVPTPRSSRAAVRIAVDLAKCGAITREEALLRIEPRNLIEHLHPQIHPGAARDALGSGLPASPGAVTGRIAFSAEAAMASEAQGESAILVRVETSPEDIRGMHSAHGVLTVRGGMTSHAAVIARGLGLPCVVGATEIRLDPRKKTLTTRGGRVLAEGDTITVDGTTGQVLSGAPPMIQPELSGSFAELMRWADEVRELGVRANADTPSDARMALQFQSDGIGLCRTEHMFYQDDRITAMREMILADTAAERAAALERLLPMQREDFVSLFRLMRGMPVTIRLLDPPLHEFLPHEKAEMHALAEAMDIPVSQVVARAEELAEFNPMLGKRGVRLAVTMPEIYEMQARAIFEAAAIVNGDAADPVVPEIMIPLVSANREVELVKSRVDAIAAAVQAERGVTLTFELGIMVETPRAALRAGDLARNTAFMSFGTNDLTQMTYGLSRDDAGRFMRDYVNQGVFEEDPFHTLDVEGVGELLLMAARRGRASNPDLVLGLCGEHGGDPASIHFCKLAGFDYVSCSPFRVPIARLAAAQATILARRGAAAPAAEGADASHA